MAEPESLYTLNIGILAQLIRYLRHIGVDADGVLLSAGVDPAMTANPDRRIPVESRMPWSSSNSPKMKRTRPTPIDWALTRRGDDGHRPANHERSFSK